MTIESSLFWMSALGLGMAHAFEPDHMAAVSTFVASKPSPRVAAIFGFKWAVGHGLSLLLFGSLLYLLKMAINQPALFSSGVIDKIVGFVLLALGLWMALQLKTGIVWPRSVKGWQRLWGGQWRERSIEEQIMEQQATARLDHQINQINSDDKMPLFGAPNSHTTRVALPGQVPIVVTRPASPRGNGSLWMGMLHGAAGTGAFIFQAAASLSLSYSQSLFYTLLVSVGVLISMTFYAGLLGRVLTWGGHRSVTILRGARWTTSIAVCVIGLCLINGVALPGLFDRFTH